MPIEEEINTIISQRLAVYCKAHKICTFFGIAATFTETPSILNGEPTATNFCKSEMNFALQPYMLVPKPASFEIISDGDYYSIFVGTEDFLNAILEVSIDAGIKDFTNKLNRYSTDRYEYKHLKKCLKACLDFNASQSITKA